MSIQCFGPIFVWSGSGFSILSEYRSGFRVLMTKNWKKFTAENFFFFFFFFKNCNLLSLGLHKGRSNYRRSLHPSKENIQLFKTWNFLIFFDFCGSFLPSWIQIRIPNLYPDTDPLTWMNPDPIRIRTREGKYACNSQILFSQKYRTK